MIPEGGQGFCKARGNLNGELITFSYGRVCATAVDPIEKKPMFHFHPGARLLSVGTFGCNLDCAFCQNAMLARAGPQDVPSNYTTPEGLAASAAEKKVDGIAWTFNDPIVWSEYIIDVSKIARRLGLFTLLNTNGYISPRARADLLEHVDAVKVDIKGFDEHVYKDMCLGELSPVLDTCKDVLERGIHLELAYPVIPGRTDAIETIRKFAGWVVDELNTDVPIHLFRFQPPYRLSQLNPAELPGLNECRDELIRSGLEFVYLGGVTGGDQDTRCPSCGALVISRASEEATEKIFVKKEQVSRFCPTFSKVSNMTKDGRCPSCGRPIIFHQT